ncbi:hypothetical protein GW17_00028344 [Ensete ventricosum]|nr:hypothetical protein GW17_00028344 [Ensete ventricosum]
MGVKVMMFFNRRGAVTKVHQIKLIGDGLDWWMVAAFREEHEQSSEHGKTTAISREDDRTESGDRYPPQPLPQLQPEAHPQLPPQQDIFSEERNSQDGIVEVVAVSGLCWRRRMPPIYRLRRDGGFSTVVKAAASSHF